MYVMIKAQYSKDLRLILIILLSFDFWYIIAEIMFTNYIRWRHLSELSRGNGAFVRKWRRLLNVWKAVFLYVCTTMMSMSSLLFLINNRSKQSIFLRVRIA